MDEEKDLPTYPPELWRYERRYMDKPRLRIYETILIGGLTLLLFPLIWAWLSALNVLERVRRCSH